jgi:hypothetical protein
MLSGFFSLNEYHYKENRTFEFLSLREKKFYAEIRLRAVKGLEEI